MRTQGLLRNLSIYISRLMYTEEKYSADYRPDVDGLRAVAVLAVVLFHAFPKHLAGGYVGVDVFFVISGFLITGIIHRNLRSDRFSFGDFWARRIRRIFPALLTVIVATFAAGWFYLLPAEFETLKSHIKWGLAFLANIKLNSEVGYFDTASELKPLLHLWSLAIEEQFYLVWPVVLWFSFRKKLNLFTLTMVLAVLSYQSRKHFSQSASDIFYFPWTRFWELQVGALLALWHDQYATRVSSVLEKAERFVRPLLMRDSNTSAAGVFKGTLSVTGLAMIVYSCVAFSKATPFPSKYTLFPVAGAALIIFSGADAWLNRTFLSLRVMRFVGIISFPLYLWHWPILSFARIVLGEPSAKVALACITLSFVLSIGTYYTIENFMRFEIGRWRWRAPALTAALCGIVVFLKYSKVGAIYTTEQSGHSSVDLMFEPCPTKLASNEPTKLSYCSVSSKSNPKVALVGDSHAHHLFHGFAENFSSSVLLAGNSSCPPILVNQFYTLNCIKKNEFLLQFLTSKKAQEIHTVLLSFFYGYAHEVPYAAQHIGAYDGITINGSAKRVIKEPAFEKGLADFAVALANSGKNVFIVRDIPEMPFLSTPCLATIPSREKLKRLLKIEPDCSIPFTAYLSRQRDFHLMYERIASQHPKIRIVDAAEPLCDGQRCSILVDGKLAYGDSHHLNEHGSNVVAKKIIEKILANSIEPISASRELEAK